MVTDIDFRHHMQVLEVRKILEHLIVVRAARFATEQEKERARQCAESMEIAISQGDSVTFMRLDGLLNDLVNGCAYHPVAVKALRPLRSLSRRFWCRYSHAYPSALELVGGRSEEHTSELQSLMRSSYAVFCWNKRNHATPNNLSNIT